MTIQSHFNRVTLAMIVGGSVSISAAAQSQAETPVLGVKQPELKLDYNALAGAPMEKLRYFRIHSWSSIDDEHVLLWTGRREPYYITLSQPCYNNDFARSLSFSSFGRTIDAKFDKIYIGNCNSRIETIQAINHEQLKAAERTIADLKREQRIAKKTKITQTDL